MRIETPQVIFSSNFMAGEIKEELSFILTRTNFEPNTFNFELNCEWTYWARTGLIANGTRSYIDMCSPSGQLQGICAAGIMTYIHVPYVYPVLCTNVCAQHRAFI